MMNPYDDVIDVACPYKNCGAGAGMECVVHTKDGGRELRDSPHVVRVRKAKEEGRVESDPDGIVSELVEDIESIA